MVVYSAVFILLSVISTVPLQARHKSRFRLPSVDKKPEIRGQQISSRENPTKPSIPRTTVSVPEVDTSREATYCQKRKQIVEIPQPRNQSGTYWPSCVSVPRCSGCCSVMSGINKCTAVRTSIRQVDVIFIPHDNTMHPRPTKVNITVHDQCQCGCRQSASSCKANEVFVASDCRCECNHNTTCPTKLRLDPTSCKCVCKYPPVSCPRNQYYSKLTCACTKYKGPL